MESAFTLLLTGVLIASVVSFVVMGLKQLRRTGALARKAHEMGLHFSATDLLGIPRRYGGFALISNGHGPRACNVTHGHVDSIPVRAFDFLYEVGHATRRMTRHYTVVAVQSRKSLGRLVMWLDEDPQAAPLFSSPGARRMGKWTVRGDLDLARVLSGFDGRLVDKSVSVEVRNDTIMFCLPVDRRRQNYIASLQCAGQLMESIEDGCA